MSKKKQSAAAPVTAEELQARTVGMVATYVRTHIASRDEMRKQFLAAFDADPAHALQVHGVAVFRYEEEARLWTNVQDELSGLDELAAVEQLLVEAESNLEGEIIKHAGYGNRATNPLANVRAEAEQSARANTLNGLRTMMNAIRSVSRQMEQAGESV